MSTDTIDLAPPQACTIEAPAHPALRRLFQRLRRPTRSDLAVGGIALLAGILYVWALGSVGSGNSYYAAAVKAATKSWRAFFLVSSPGESHPRALAEPYVTVSRHTAPTGRFWVSGSSHQWGNYSGVGAGPSGSSTPGGQRTIPLTYLPTG